MGCMCADCKYAENPNSVLTICKCEISARYKQVISLAWDDCDCGEVDMEESEEE